MKNGLLVCLAIVLFFSLSLSSCSEPTHTISNKHQTFTSMMKEYDATFPEVPKVEIDELKNFPKDTYVLIDIREAKEREVSWIPGSVSLEDFEKNPDLYRNKLLIPYCTIGYRSAYQTRIFNNQGFQAKNFKGSILMWVWKENPLTDKQGPTHKVHVYGKKWDLLPEGYTAVFD